MCNWLIALENLVFTGWHRKKHYIKNECISWVIFHSDCKFKSFPLTNHIRLENFKGWARYNNLLPKKYLSKLIAKKSYVGPTTDGWEFILNRRRKLKWFRLTELFNWTRAHINATKGMTTTFANARNGRKERPVENIENTFHFAYKT